ncbi:hypothetical protein MRX96_003584 [Rhipicephalus microplus]
MLKFCLFFTQLTVGLDVTSLHHLTAVGNTDGRCATATLDGFTSSTSRHSWGDLVTSSLLGRNSPHHCCAYCAFPICLPVGCYASSEPIRTQAKWDRNQSDVILTRPIAGFRSATTPLPGQDKLLPPLSHFFSGQGDSGVPTMLKSCLFFTQLTVGLDVTSLHHLTVVGNTDDRRATATLDGFTSGTSRRS